MVVPGGSSRGNVSHRYKNFDKFEFDWRFYTQSASEAIFRARAYSHNLFSPVMIT